MRIILASNSPRRKELLQNIGLNFEVLTSSNEENHTASSPNEIVKELAIFKGKSVKEQYALENELIISCDTIVYANGEVLGKPKDKNDAYNMLKKLSNSVHSVFSGLSIIYKNEVYSDFCETKVKFKKLTDDEIEFYISTDEPYDKAGGYGIQGLASIFIEKIDGDYFNVMGFPLNLFYEMMKSIGEETNLLNII